jgi:anti-sigma B factor antagonist
MIMLSYSSHPGGGRAVVTPPAEIDLNNAVELQDELDAALDRGITTLVVDMSGTTFCDSAGAAALVRAQTRATDMNADLRVVIIKESFVRRVFELNGVDQILPIYTSLDAAQGSIGDDVIVPPS